jgi:hypothetical protein
MQTCSQCNAQSLDTAANCVNCGADLSEYSETAVAINRFQANPRVRNVRLVVMKDACPACQQIEGTYPKDAVPSLPAEGCSHHLGCRCFYQPFLDEIYP